MWLWCFCFLSNQILSTWILLQSALQTIIIFLDFYSLAASTSFSSHLQPDWLWLTCSCLIPTTRFISLNVSPSCHLLLFRYQYSHSCRMCSRTDLLSFNFTLSLLPHSLGSESQLQIYYEEPFFMAFICAWPTYVLCKVTHCDMFPVTVCSQFHNASHNYTM